MDPACLEYCLTDEERRAFETDGYFVVPEALPPSLVSDLIAVVDRLDELHRPREGRGPHELLNHWNFIGEDDLFLELLDWPKTFPKVWGILGWHIQLYHTHMNVTPPASPEARAVKKRMGWHQDSGRLNLDLETNPRPRVSLKVGYFLTDTSEPGCGNMFVIPGSHLQNRISFPDDGVSEPEGAVPLCLKPGDAVFFDRRIWHTPSPNHGERTRKVLFYGYSYRWLKPRDDMTVAHLMDRCSPVRRQLLGASPSGGHGYTSPTEEDVPLKGWIREHLGEAAVVP
jgi:hypothetical protein